MTTQKQIRANKVNAKRGGVKSDSGKAVSKYNAQKHAILRESITEYEADLHQSLLKDLEATYQPIGRIEAMLVERIAIHYIKLYRVQKSETEYMKSCLDPRKTHIEGGFELIPIGEPEVLVIDNEGYTPRLDSSSLTEMANVFGRYETTVENKLYKALHELERMQRTRKGDTVAAPLAVDVGLGSFSERSIL